MKTWLLIPIIFVFVLVACTQDNVPKKQMQQEAKVMKTYMIVTAEISDRDAFLGGYAATTGPLVKKFGGRYVMAGPGARLLEGDWGDGASMLISEWPDMDAVDAFWNSAEYAEAKKLREGIADVQVLVIKAEKFTKD